MEEVAVSMVLPNNLVLVIEDDPDMQQVVSDMLREAGYEPVSALTGGQGYELAVEKMPGLIILDLNLPDIDGIEVCQMLSKNESTKGIPVVVLTSRFDLSAKLNSFMAGAKRYVTKPFEINALLKEIENAFRQRGMRSDPEV